MYERTRPGVVISVIDGDGQIVSRAADVMQDRILSFSFQDSDKKADVATISLRNHDLHLFEMGDDILGGTTLEVSWGFPGLFAPPRRVVIKKISGGETLQVEALAESMQLHRVMRSREFVGKTRAQVVKEVGLEAGYRDQFLSVEETGEVFEVLTQNNETDAGFMTRLAAREGFIFYVDDTGLHWHQRRFDLAPSHTFEWRGGDQGTIMSFSFESNLVRRVGRVRVVGRDPMEKKDINAEAVNESVERTTLGMMREVVNPETLVGRRERMSTTDVVRATAAGNLGRAQREADARFRSADRETVELRMRVVGDPTIRAKTVVVIRGLTRMFDGLYYIREVTHHIDGSGGYHCELKMISDALGRLGREAASRQGGDRNRQETEALGAVVKYEVVDPEVISRTRIEYRRNGQVVGVEDKKAGVSREQ